MATAIPTKTATTNADNKKLSGFFSPTTLLRTVFGPLGGPTSSNDANQKSAETTEDAGTLSPLRGDRETSGDEDASVNILSRALSLAFRAFTHWLPGAEESGGGRQTLSGFLSLSPAPPTISGGGSAVTMAEVRRIWLELLGVSYALSTPTSSAGGPLGAEGGAVGAVSPAPGAAVVELVELYIRDALHNLNSTSLLCDASDSPEKDNFWQTTYDALRMFPWWAPRDASTIPTTPSHPQA